LARKRKKIKDLRGEDPFTQSYWDEILQREGLGMGAGTTSKLSYAGSGTRLEWIDGVEHHSSGRVDPKKSLE
jgi:hypothetical protein